ncbi:hypothetical protein LVY72_07975 [Arthrobacter sp. I2-34]|uniref:Carnitinyl-CoA dehydratase n=1 Tax=Arthrobacter hankyongi TaxID=2904801 RepID=A0ABS9L5V0_9MICC|nr:hypothetical protein [Arthrobacter hankyongi]
MNRLVPADRVLAAAKDLAFTICESAPLSVAATLEVVEAVEGYGEEEAFRILRNDLPTVAKVVHSIDAKEGARAFVEKRPPIWRGC